MCIMQHLVQETTEEVYHKQIICLKASEEKNMKMFYTVGFTPTNTNDCTRLIRNNYRPLLLRKTRRSFCFLKHAP